MTENENPLNKVAAMFGFVPAETVADESQATLAYGPRKVVVNPDDYVNAAEAFSSKSGPDDLDLDVTGFVNYSRDGEVIPAGAPLEAGGYYVATTRHDDKG